MKKQLIGSVVFLTAFFFGTAIAQQAAQASAPGQPPVIAVTTKVAAEGDHLKNNDEPLLRYGWYALDEFKGMNEVTMVLISDGGNDEDTSGGGVFTTFEQYGDQGFFSSTWIKINGNHVSFTTEEIRGILYRFEGTFLSDDWSHLESEKPLYGTLKKFVKGKLVAETTGNLKYFRPHCWH
jgi:hypothetical protein